MKCPECKQKIKKDVRLIAFHIAEAHKLPFSVLIATLHRLGFSEEETHQFHKYPILNPRLHAKTDSNPSKFFKLFSKQKEATK